jgi:hypothetical protein
VPIFKRRLAINRANAKKSSGPQSAAGAENGFVSQKRMEAKEIHTQEDHELRMGVGREHLDQGKK